MSDSSAPPNDDVAAARLVRRVLAQWPLIVACALVAAVAGYFASASQPKKYEATTTVQLNDIDLASVFLAQNLQQPGQDAQTKAATAASLAMLPRVRQAASSALGGRVSPSDLKNNITVTPQADTTLVDFTAKAATPQLAADEANALREAFIATRQESTASTLQAARTRVQQQLNHLPASQKDSSAAQSLGQRLDQINTLIVTTGAGVTTAQEATPPSGASSPKPKRDAVLALLAGGLLGLIIAALRARLDDTVRDRAEYAEHWNLPVIGLIPESDGLAGHGKALPAPALLEAFALTRTNLRYLHVGGEKRILVVTSAIAEEGKSTVAWHLAVATAMAGQRVLLLEADLRRPVLAGRLGVTGGRGLSEYLAGIANVDEVVHPVSVADAGEELVVDVVPAGFAPPSPIALLERSSTGEAIRALSASYDVVIVDTPPATMVADAKVLLEHADGVVIVTKLGRVTRSAVDRLRDTLSGVSTPILGLVVNAGASEAEYGYASTERPLAKTPESAPDPAQPDRLTASA